MIRQTFARSTEPDVPALGLAIVSLLPPSAGSASIDYDAANQLVGISLADWTGVNLTSIQTQVTNAVQRTDFTDNKDQIDGLPKWLKAAFFVALDQVNTLRGLHSLAAVTPAQFLTAVKAKIDTL